MILDIEAIPAPDRLAQPSRECLDDARALGFGVLGWLRIELLAPVVMACLSAHDGELSLGLVGDDSGEGFAHHHVDLVSHLDNGRKLVTTTMPFVLAQPDRGLFKHAHPELGLAQLLMRHAQYVLELKATPALRVRTLAEFERSLRDFVALELGLST